MEKIVNISTVNPITFQLQNYSSEDGSLIASFTQDITFNPNEDYVEYHILDINKKCRTSSSKNM